MKFSEGIKLAQDPLSGCVVVREHVQHMWLSPRYLNGRIRSGVKGLLEKQIGKYNESLDGICLAYSNVKVMQRASFLLYDSVDMHFDVQYDAVIFRACSGTLLKCIVNKVSADHLGCLIHKFINMSVPVPAWTFDPSQVIGQEMICKVTKVEYKKGVLGVFGELTDDSLTSLQERFAACEEMGRDEEEMYVSQNNNTIDLSTGTKEKKGKKRKRKVFEDIEHQESESFSNTSQNQDDSLLTSSLGVEETSDSHNSDLHSLERDCRDIKVKKKKKKHKRKNADEIENNDQEESVNLKEEDLQVKNEKRKKIRKRTREDVSEDFEDFNDSGINSLSNGHLDGEEILEHNESLNGDKKKHKKKCKKRKMCDD